ncbi:hypothetical protein GCM10017779_17110 [Streptomyces capillispiralis]|nr:hypothetical protein GCM10017779_17110 [Streptomyces capillispiralis]
MAARAWVIGVPPGEPGRPRADVLLRHHRADRPTSAAGRPGEPPARETGSRARPPPVTVAGMQRADLSLTTTPESVPAR